MPDMAHKSCSSLVAAAYVRFAVFVAEFYHVTGGIFITSVGEPSESPDIRVQCDELVGSGFETPYRLVDGLRQ